MARQKQSVPLKRVPSGLAHGAPEPQQDGSNEQASGRVNGEIKSAIAPAMDTEQQSGVLQLAICVGGIYASLYVAYVIFVSYH